MKYVWSDQVNANSVSTFKIGTRHFLELAIHFQTYLLRNQPNPINSNIASFRVFKNII